MGVDFSALENYIGSELQKTKLLQDTRDFIAEVRGLDQNKSELQKQIDDLQGNKQSALDDINSARAESDKNLAAMKVKIENMEKKACDDSDEVIDVATRKAEVIIADAQARADKFLAGIEALRAETEQAEADNTEALSSLADTNNKITAAQANLDAINDKIDEGRKLFGA